MSWIDGPCLGWDLETTGTDLMTARPVSFALVDFDWGTVVKARTGLINPEIPVPLETTAIHGISDADVQERGGNLERSIDGITAKLLEASLASIPLIGTNLKFDLGVIDCCHRMLNDGAGLEDLGWEGLVIDVLVIDRGVDRYRRGKRNLTALCETYGVAMVDAHTAGGDVTASFNVAQAIADRYPEVAAMDIEELHAKQVVWHREWAENYSEHRESKGEPPLEPREFFWPLMLSADTLEKGTHSPDQGSIKSPDLAADGLPANPEFDVDPPDPSDRLVTTGECANLRIRLQEDHGIKDRQDVLDIVSGIVDHTIDSTKELTRAEFVRVQEDLLVMKGTVGVAVLLSEARNARGGTDPQTAGESATASESAPAGPKYEPFEEIDLGGASLEVTQTTMRKIMKWDAKECSKVLGQFGLPKTGTLTVKRLRLYEAICRERAKGNAEAEALFEVAP